MPDWVLTFVLAGLLSIINKAYGFRREFSLTDTSLQHTYAVQERVPVWLLVVVAVLIPIALIALIALLGCRSLWDCHAGLLGLILAHALTLTATTIIKVTVGRPRPDVIDRCQPRAGAANGVPYGLVTDAICTVDPSSALIRDGFRSFPSGHASTAFAGLTFLSLYLAGKLHIFDKRGHAATAWLVFFPMIGAALIAISRTMDYRHHATDVIAGGILGTSIALVIYHLYYPALWDARSHKPWAPRIPRQGSGLIGADGAGGLDAAHGGVPGGASPDELEAEGLAASGGPSSSGLPRHHNDLERVSSDDSYSKPLPARHGLPQHQQQQPPIHQNQAQFQPPPFQAAAPGRAANGNAPVSSAQVYRDI